MNSFEISAAQNPYYYYHFIKSGLYNSYLTLNQLDKELLCRKKEIDIDDLTGYCRHISACTEKRPDIKNRMTAHLLRHFPFLAYYENVQPGKSIEVLEEYLQLLHGISNELIYHKRSAEKKDIPAIQELFEYARNCAGKKTMLFGREDIYLHKTILREEEKLTPKGFCFFLCLFLDKKQALTFLSETKVFAEESGDSRKSVIECFILLCCKPPREKNEQSNLALDILNELNRCPKELFHLLSDEDKKAFYVNERECSEIMPAPMKRYCDRFPYFSLRYFDQSKVLDGITFHLQLGHRHKEEAHTKHVNSVERTHPILKPMRTFSELAYYRNMEAGNFFNSDEEIESYAPQYRITGNRVGLLLDVAKPQKYEVVKKNIPPQAIISTHELGALFFYNQLYRQKLVKESPKELIAAYIRNFNRFISDMQAGRIGPVDAKAGNQKEILAEKLKPYGLEISYLPDACKEYLLSYRRNNKEIQIKNKLKRMLYETKRRINTINKLKEKEDAFNKMQMNDRLSKELAHDIVYLTPPHEVNRKGIPHLQKIGNMEFEVMQKMLAYFNGHKRELRDYLNILSVKDRGRNKWLHPFLYKMVLYDLEACDDLAGFCIRYYERRERWLLGMIRFSLTDKKWMLLKSAWEISGQYNYFLKLNKDKPALKKEYSGETVFLPTGVFDKEIAAAMKKAGYDAKEGDNAAYCMKLYYDGLSQHYYSLPRYYDVSAFSEEQDTMERDMLKNRINALWTKVDEPSQKRLKLLSKQIKETESDILTRQYNDRVLFLMANDLLPETARFRKEDIAGIGFNLSDNVLSKPYTISETIYGRKIVAKLPIKGYGEFRNFMNDRKLSSLLRYYPEGKEIVLGEIKSREELNNHHILAGELRSYEQRKKELLDQMYLFEHTMRRKYGESIKLSDIQSVHVTCLEFAYHTLGILRKSGQIPSGEAFLELIRSILCDHIPHLEWIEENVSGKGEENISGKIIDLLLNVYKDTNKTLLTT